MLIKILEAIAEVPLYIGERLSKHSLRNSLRSDNESIFLNPMDADLYHRRGRTYARGGQSDRAIQDYTEALRLNPQLREAYADRALAHNRVGDAAQARQDVEKAVELGVRRTMLEKELLRQSLINENPLDGIEYADRALVRAYRGDATQAREDVDKAVELGVDRTILEEEVERRLKRTKEA